jgi:hypothetical protein
MSERDLRTFLRDHLADEPPVRVTSLDAIGAGRRQGRVRLAVGGGAVLLVGALTAGATTVLGGDDGPGRAEDVPAASQPTETPIQDRIDVVAEEQLAPVVGGLKVGGFAEEDSDFFLAPVCPAYEAKGVTSSCQDETIDDGTLVTTLVGPHTRVTNTSSRLPTVQWALRHPDRVLWARTGSVATPGGVTTTVSEYVEATAPEVAGWRLPVDVLRAAATDAELLDPAAVAHDPMS